MTTAPVDLFALAGSTLDGRYDVERLVAEGGFGVVYKGTHLGLRKPVAIKVLKVPASLDAALRVQFLEKFSQEARLLADLDHPAVVRALDFGVGTMPTGEVAPWMVLEWLDGAPLEDDLEARRGAGGRSPAEALALLRPAIEALAAAHEAGIAHRDLKPANLMLARGRRGEVALRVLDFGIAKVMRDDDRADASGHTATQSRLQAFSLPYAAPEQVSGTRTGAWTDVHALGLIVTELLTDASPYPDGELTELYAAVLSPTRPTPARCGLDVGPWESVLARAVAFRPADRFQSAGAFLAALEATVPERAPRTATDDAVTTPRSRTPAEPRTTLRPAEVRSQASPRRPARRRLPLIVSGVVAFAAFAVVVSRITSSPPARGAPTRAPAPLATPIALALAPSRQEPAPAPAVMPPIDAAVPGSPTPRPRARATGARDAAVLRRVRPQPDPAPPAPSAPAAPRYIPAE